MDTEEIMEKIVFVIKTQKIVYTTAFGFLRPVPLCPPW